MGRLFWRILASFLVGMLLLTVGVALGSRLYFEARLGGGSALAFGPHALAEVQWAAYFARFGDERLLRELAKDWPGELSMPLIVAADGSERLGRPVPPAALASARRLAPNPGRAPVLSVAAADGSPLLVFAPEGKAFAPRPPHGVHVTMPLIFALAAILAGLAVSTWLARNLSQRIVRLRGAFDALANGALHTRVADQLKGKDEIVELGRDFDHMAARLEALVGAQRRLLHDVSHELRSPLARLQVAVGLVRQQPERTAQALGRIEREVERLNALIAELLTLSRLESGPAPKLDAHIDLVELLQGVVDDARFEAMSEGKDVRLRDDGEGEVLLLGNGELLHRAFENVLRNALRHSPLLGEVEVSIERRVAGQILVSVADRGPGLAEHELEAVFQPFVHGSGSSGAGLGLAIARRAVEAHGGRIWAAPRSSGGLVVSCSLPLPPAPPVELAPPTAPA